MTRMIDKNSENLDLDSIKYDCLTLTTALLHDVEPLARERVDGSLDIHVQARQHSIGHPAERIAASLRNPGHASRRF